jgi:hypothetical protein
MGETARPEWQQQHCHVTILMTMVLLQADTAESQAISNSLLAIGKRGEQVSQQQLDVLLAAFTAAGMLGQAKAQAIANVLLGMAYQSRVRQFT